MAGITSYSRVIDQQRRMPPLEWRAIIAGVALAGVISLIAAALLPPIPAALASFFGLFVSGILAGKLAPAARLYHGAVVGAGYVLSEAVGLVPSGFGGADALSDTVVVIVTDALRIALAAFGGWSARGLAGAEPPPGASSSDTGRGR